MHSLTRSSLAWILLGCVGAACAFGSLALGIWPRWASLLTSVSACSVLAVLGWYYGAYRKEQRIARVLTAVVWILAFTLGGGYLTYLGAATGAPLQDSVFAQADHVLGFSWIALHQAVNQSPVMSVALSAAYASSTYQILIVFLCLGLARSDDRLWEFLILYGLTALLTIGVAAAVPALGAYSFHFPHGAPQGAIPSTSGIWHMAHVMALRDGLMTTVDLTAIEGVVTFPSFHTALAVVCMWSTRRIPYVHRPMIILNLIVILSTIPIGGHYLIDVLAGGAIAAVAIAVDRYTFIWRTRRLGLTAAATVA